MQKNPHMLYQPNTRRLVFIVLLTLSSVMTVFEWPGSDSTPISLIGLAIYMLLMHKFLVPNIKDKNMKELYRKLGDLGVSAGIVAIAILVLKQLFKTS